MSNLSTCRVCLLSGNVKFHLVLNTPLQDVFEKFTSFKLSTRDERPERVCSTCCWQLQRCRRFRDKSAKSEGILTQLFHHGIEISQETITVLNRKIQHDFVVTPIERMSYNCPKNEIQEAVKEEPSDTYPQTAQVKEEPVTVKQESQEESALVEDEVSEGVTALCRVCLAEHVTSHAIRDTPLQDVFEKLTNTKINTENGIPETVCYICRAQLKRCQKFMIQASKSESIVTELFRNGVKLTQSIGYILNRRVKLNLAKTPMETHACGVNEAAVKLAVVKVAVVKLERLVIKQELVDQESALVGDGARPVYNKNMTKIIPKEIKEILTTDVVPGTSITTTEEKKFWKTKECDVCDYKCATDDIMAIHKRFHDPTRAYPCEECTHRYKTFASLRQHKNSVHKTKHKCTKCYKRFTNMRKLKMHMLIHEDQAYTCQKCNKIFRLRPQLIMHNRTFHPRDRHPCAHCAIVCTSAHLLREHVLKLHVGKFQYYICDICRKKFTDKSFLRKHMINVHIKPTQYTCDICKKSYSLKQTLRTHLILHAEKRPYGCTLCSKAYCTKAALQLHFKNHTGEKPFICEICNKAFRDKDLLKSHLKTHIGAKLICDLCRKEYTNKFQLKMHILVTHMSHIPEKSHVCEVCGNKYYFKHALKNHMKTHTKMRAEERLNLPCDICHKILRSDRGFMLHMQAHAGQYLYSCDQCDKSFSYKTNFREHIKLHYGIQIKPHACDMCVKRFRTKGDLETHKRSHTGEKPYACDLCDQTFTQSSGLTCHMRIHTGEKPFACDLCDKTFAEERGRQQHKLMSHIKRAQYICDMCCRVYNEKETFIHHVKTHKKKKPYTCYKCNLSFSAMTRLARHMRTHDGDKFKSCSMCENTYRQGTNMRRHYLLAHGVSKALACNRCGEGFNMDDLDRLVRHMRLHDGEKPYDCEFCGKSFIRGSGMRRHIRRLHNPEK